MIKFTNWISLFSDEKICVVFTFSNNLNTATANYFVAQNTQMIDKTNGHFVLHINSNTSLHLIALIVQSIELIPTKKSKQSLRYKRLHFNSSRFQVSFSFFWPRNLVST